MQNIIQIYPCLLKLSHKQDTVLKIGDFSTKNYDFPPKSLLQIFPCKNPSKIMIIISHMQKIIQIHPCLLKLSRKQESVTDGQTDGRPLLLYPSYNYPFWGHYKKCILTLQFAFHLDNVFVNLVLLYCKSDNMH